MRLTRRTFLTALAAAPLVPVPPSVLTPFPVNYGATFVFPATAIIPPFTQHLREAMQQLALDWQHELDTLALKALTDDRRPQT